MPPPSRGKPGVYWRWMSYVWQERAAVCRYGHVPLSEVLGRDLVRRPLTALERAFFTWAITEHVIAERKPLAEMGLPPSED